MTVAVLMTLACLAVSSPPRQASGAAAEVIAEVRVHGNHVSSDEEILKIAAVTIGAPFTATTVAEVTRRLDDSGLFDDVDVLKRFASIADASKIALVIVVNEGPVRIEMPGAAGGVPRAVRRNRLTNVMWLPILDGQDGYGLTFGARVAYVGVGGKRGRLSFPLTWGGLKQAGVEYDRAIARGPLSRIEVGASLQRQRNPAFDEQDDRTRLWVRAEKARGPLRASAVAGWQRVAFGSRDDKVRSIGAGLTYDTRLNPVLPRDAVFVTAEVARDAGWALGSGVVTTSAVRTRVDAHGYVGLVGQSVLVVRGLREHASQPLPPYLKSLLGGWSNLRGFKAGSWAGDSLTAASLEVRQPISSPLSAGKLGLSLFADTGTAYDTGARLSDQTWRTGYGGGVWFAVAAFRLDLSVAHGRGATTRVNFGAGIEF